MLLYEPVLKTAARQLRTNMTKAEQLIWSAIRRKNLDGVQFYRQKCLGPYIVDFYAPVVKLVIEIDGAHHLEKEYLDQDKYRDSYLKALELRALRFENFQVINHLPKVVDKILYSIQKYRYEKTL